MVKLQKWNNRKQSKDTNMAITTCCRDQKNKRGVCGSGRNGVHFFGSNTLMLPCNTLISWDKHQNVHYLNSLISYLQTTTGTHQALTDCFPLFVLILKFVVLTGRSSKVFKEGSTNLLQTLQNLSPYQAGILTQDLGDLILTVMCSLLKA